MRRPSELFLAKAWDRLEAIYTRRHDRRWWRQRFGTLLAPPPRGRPSARRLGDVCARADYDFKRSERLEALVLLLRVLIARHDGRTMRVCVDAPTADDQVVGLSTSWLSRACGLSRDRVERALCDLKSAGFELWRHGARNRRVPRQPREWVPESLDAHGRLHPGRWKAWPAVRVLDGLLFRALEMGLEHSVWRQKKAREWLVVQKQRGDGPARPRPKSAPVIELGGLFQRLIQRPGEQPKLQDPLSTVGGQRQQRTVDAYEQAARRSRLFVRVMTAHPDWSPDAVRAEVKRLLD